MAPSQVPDALVAKKFGAESLLAKPLTFMNRSGEAVGGAGALSTRSRPPTCWSSSTTWTCRSDGCARGARGSAGGHNGLKSIVERLGHHEFPRLRLGVGRGDPRRDLADHVLVEVRAPTSRRDARAVIARAADAAEMFAADGHREGDEHVQRGPAEERSNDDSDGQSDSRGL